MNPNDIIRKKIRSVFKNAKYYAALNDTYPQDRMAELMFRIEKTSEEKGSSEFDLMLAVMYVDYYLYLENSKNTSYVDEEEEELDDELEDEEEYEEGELLSEEEMIKTMSSLEEIREYIHINPSILYEMALSTDTREIDLANTYSVLETLDQESKEHLCSIYKPFIYDYMEFNYPFLINKLHNNLKTNPFLEDVTSKSIGAIDMLEEVKKCAYKDYLNMLAYYLEIYYKHKKYGVNHLDSILTKKERKLINLLETEQLDVALQLLSIDMDLLEVVLNVYSGNCFEQTTINEEVNKYFNIKENKERLNLIFRKDK